MFGYTMYHKPSFEFCHGIFRKKNPFLAYILYRNKCVWDASKNRGLPQD